MLPVSLDCSVTYFKLNLFAAKFTLSACELNKQIMQEEVHELDAFYYACFPSRLNIAKLHKSFHYCAQKASSQTSFFVIVFLHHYMLLGPNKLNMKRNVAHLPFYSGSGVISKWRVYIALYIG